MIFVSLASGSSGNCTLLHTEHENILIDCGISAKRIADSLRAFDLDIGDLDAVLLTHEHSDHIKGLKRLMSAYSIPVYASEGTLEALPYATRDEYFRFAGTSLMYPVSADREFYIGSTLICPFHIYHDAAAPLGYRAEAMSPGDGQSSAARRAVCVTTDTGYYDDYIRDHLLYLDAALIESNHDRGMLAGGRYPVSLKRRIMSRQGHLCNNQTGKLIAEVLSPRLKHVFLGHLSKENNTPKLALDTVKMEISEALGAERAESLSVSVAPQDGPPMVISL